MGRNSGQHEPLCSQKKTTLGADALQQMQHSEYKSRSCLNAWKDVDANDIKMFVAHLLVMGLVKKPKLEKYWSHDTFTTIPFFGKYLSRDKFCNILWNLHIIDDSQNPQFGADGHDPLAKLRSA